MKKIFILILASLFFCNVSYASKNTSDANAPVQADSKMNNNKLADFNTAPMPTDAQLTPAMQAELKQLPPLNVFRMMTNVPQSFGPFIQMVKSLINHGTLNPRLREIAILRTAYLTHAPYEWHQHVFIAKANGVTDKEIAALNKENPVHSLDEEANFVCKVTDELTKNVNLSDKTFKQLYGRYDNHKASELILAISFYNMVSRFLNGTRVQIEKTNPLEGHASPLN